MRHFPKSLIGVNGRIGGACLHDKEFPANALRITRRMRSIFHDITALLFSILCGLSVNAQADDLPHPLVIHSAAIVYAGTVSAGAHDSTSPRRRVRVGVGLDGFVPFYLNRDRNVYEGITADYLYAISQISHLDFDVQLYESGQAARQALREGKIDLLPDVPHHGDGEFVWSNPYFMNRQVEVRLTDGSADVKQHSTIAVARGQITDPAFSRGYPADHITEYATPLQALQAVAFGTADMFIGNATEANFLIDQLQLLQLSIVNFANVAEPSFVFMGRRGGEGLIQDVNGALRVIPGSVVSDIQQRWLGATNNFDIRRNIRFSKEEQLWIKGHPVIKYTALKDLAPFVFRENANDDVTGLSVDVLNLISKKTGIKFSPVVVDDNEAAFTRFAQRDVDLLTSIVPTDRRRDVMLFTHPYAQTLWVLVTHKNNTSIRGPADLGGKRLGILAGTREALVVYPQPSAGSIQLVDAPNVVALFDLLASGKVDAISMSGTVATFVISQRGANAFKIVSTINESPGQIGMATHLDWPILVSIIDKVIEVTPQEDMDALRRDWIRYRPNRIISGLSEQQARRTMMALTLLLGVLVAGAGYLGFKVYQKRRKEAQLQLRLNHQDLLINALPFAVFLVDRDWNLSRCNQHFADAFGQTRSVLVKGPGFPRAEQEQNLLDNAIGELRGLSLKDPRSHDVDRHGLIRGEERDLYLWLIPIRGKDGEIDSFVCGWLDITQRKTTERQLDKARLDADSANRAKSTFLATISHEIRTPMNTILGLLELELESPQPPNRESIAMVRETAKSLQRLIDDVLDYSKAEAGKLSISLGPANIVSELGRLVTMYRPLCREKGIAFDVLIDEHIPPQVVVDALRVRQIIGNLLSNALKFTQQGSITLRAEWQPEDQATGWLQVQVADTGIGIRKEDQSALFQPFVQSAQSVAQKFGGTGLGLWICKHLVDQMAGAIELTSQPGAGTSIRIRLPLPVATTTQARISAVAPRSPGAVNKNLRVLSVDDLPANCLLMKRQLAFLQVKDVVTAESGAEALTLLERSEFDLVLTDCLMPGMDGYELTRTIRKANRWPGLLIVGCTADGRPEIRKRAIEAGMDDLLVKPIDLQSLQQLLAQYFGHAGQASSVAESQTTNSMTSSVQAALEMISGGQPNVRLTLANSLISHNDADAELLSQAVRQGRLDEAARHVHKIKGAAGVIGAKTLEASCVRLETAIRARDTETINVELSVVQADVTQLRDQLNALTGQSATSA